MFLTQLQFYIDKGWNMLPAPQATVSLPSYQRLVPTPNQTNLPITRLLTSEDVSNLCALDAEDIRASLGKQTGGSSLDEVHVAVLPTPNIISWLHARGDFISLRIHGKTPQSRGAMRGDVWLYWYHDFREQQLAISRLHTPVVEEEDGRPQSTTETILASLLMDAMEEAHRWDLPRVIVCDPSPDMLRAVQLLPGDIGVDIVNEEGVSKSIPSVRWRGSNKTGKVNVYRNDFSAWSWQSNW